MHPLFYNWYTVVCIFHANGRKSWDSNKPALKLAEAPQKVDLGLGGSDSDSDSSEEEDPEVKAARLPAIKAKAAANKKVKKVRCAKSMIVFDVKVFEMSEDFDDLYDEIVDKVKKDGLVWN